MGTVLNMSHGVRRALDSAELTIWITTEPVESKGWVEDMLGPQIRYKLDLYEGAINTPVTVDSVRDVKILLQFFRKSGEIRVWNNTNVKDSDFGLDTDEVIEKM